MCVQVKLKISVQYAQVQLEFEAIGSGVVGRRLRVSVVARVTSSSLLLLVGVVRGWACWHGMIHLRDNEMTIIIITQTEIYVDCTVIYFIYMHTI